MFKYTYFFLVLSFSVQSLLSQKINFKEYDLENGMHVILHQDNSNPIVAVSVLYHVGSKNENPERTGFAHFFEHLLFEGSKNIRRGEFSKYVASAGGRNNANTTQDRTFYYELLPSNQLKLGLWLESERLLHAKVDAKGIETQREVVKEEKRLRIDNQAYQDAVSRVIWDALYKKHPYSWPVIGSMEHIDRAQEEDYKSFYKEFYVPNNATLSIAGDINIKETKKWIDDYFGSIPTGKGKARRPTEKEEPIQEEIVLESKDKNVQLPATIFAYRVPKQTDKDSYVLNIISRVLASGESSRFTKRIVNEKQLAVASGSFLWKLEDYGTFICYGIVNQGVSTDKLQTAMDIEIEKLKKEGITQRELQKQINRLEKDFVSSNSTVAGIAESLANYHIYYGDANLINTEIERYRKITIEDVKRVAKKYLNKNRRVKVFVQPVPVGL